MSNNAITELHKKWSEIGSHKILSSTELQLELYKKILDIVQVGPSYYFIFSPSNQRIEFTSHSIENVLGITSQDFTLDYILTNTHLDDLNNMADFETAVVSFKKQLPLEKLMKYKSRYNYRLKKNKGDYVHILQQSVTIEADEEGKIIRNLIIHTDISEISDFRNMKLSFIGLENEPSFHDVKLQKKFSASKEVFSQRELEILKLVVQGMNSNAIAEHVCRSVHTIRNHRKNILEKSGCRNVQELLVKSVREGWV